MRLVSANAEGDAAAILCCLLFELCLVVDIALASGWVQRWFLEFVFFSVLVVQCSNEIHGLTQLSLEHPFLSLLRVSEE